MKFHDFVQFLSELESVSGRNEMIKMLATFIEKPDGKEIQEVLYLIQGRLVPKYVNLEFNFSRKLIFRSLETLLGENAAGEIKTLFSKYGDVGYVAEEVIKKHATNENRLIAEEKLFENPTVNQVYKVLEEIALYMGKGSQDFKMKKYIQLVSSLDELSIRYATRIIIGEVRLGLSDKSILDALSWFAKGDKSLRESLDSAFGAKADIGELAYLVVQNKENVETVLENIHIEAGVPLASKLVEREIDAASVWKRMPECFVQPKLDGLRGQLHYSKKGFDNPMRNKAAIFSRNMEDMTEQFPELIKSLNELGVDSIILDSEIIGFNNELGKYLTYQETMQRKRKYDIENYSTNVPVNAMCFDILFLNGKDLTKTPIEERIKLLTEIIGEKGKGSLKMLETKKVKSEQELLKYFEDKVGIGLEGIIAKAQNTTYEPGSRNFKWIKLKANTRSDLVDTIDVLVMGYYIGRGQRAKYGIGALLTGVYDPVEDKYYTVGKVGSGIKDEMFPIIQKDLEPLKTDTMPENYVVDKTLFPDYWIQPSIIMELDADEITRSPNHTAARGIKTDVINDKFDRGLSIRFPRLKIWKRDKDIPNTVFELLEIYQLRKGKK